MADRQNETEKHNDQGAAPGTDTSAPGTDSAAPAGMLDAASRVSPGALRRRISKRRREQKAPGGQEHGVAHPGGAPAAGGEAPEDDDSNDAAAEASDGGGAAIHRKADGGPVDAMRAGAVLDTAQRTSAGSPLAADVRAPMESSFGHDFSGVRVHTDGAAAQAATSLNARAFTAGSDVYFNKGAYEPGSSGGQHLLAHELAHVAQGASGAAKSSGDGASISSPSDPAELAADRAADAVVSGGPMPSLGGAPSSVLHRDALSDLDQAASGNWLGSVNNADLVRRVGALSDADQGTLVTGHADTMRRLFSKLNVVETMRVVEILQTHLTFVTTLNFLNSGSKLGSLKKGHWMQLMAYFGASLDVIRANTAAWALFTQNAPRDIVPALDRLRLYLDGNWLGQVDSGQVLNCVSELNDTGKTAVRGDAPMMRRLGEKLGHAEFFRAITQLNFELKDQISWLKTTSHDAGLSREQWAQLVSEAPRAQLDAVVAIPNLWAVLQTRVDAAVLQTIRGNRTADGQAVTTTLNDPVQINLMMTSLGGPAVLALATQPGADIATNYTKLDAAGKIDAILDSLPRGAALSPAQRAGLKAWALLPAASTARRQKIMTIRFGVTIGGSGGQNATGAQVNHAGQGATTADWTLAGITRMWTIIEAMPPTAVERNPSLEYILHNSAAGPGSGYQWGRDINGDNSVVLGNANDADLNNANTNPGIWNAGYAQNSAGTNNNAVAGTKMFNATVRHEIGHAVDQQLAISDSCREQAWAGGWVNYTSAAAFVDAIIAHHPGGLSAFPEAKRNLYKQAMVAAVTNRQRFPTALAGINATEADPGDVAPISAVYEVNRWFGGGASGPWYDHTWRPVGGHNFQQSYASTATFHSFLGSTRDAKKVSDYQWRAPKEWFAECYQVFYIEQDSNPAAQPGGVLRGRDPQAANLIHSVVDQGFSLQAAANRLGL